MPNIRRIIWEREPPPQRIGLVLGGGAARGGAHVGVLQVLTEHGIEPHAIAGTSAGALVGGLYAAGMSPEAMARHMHNLKWGTLSTLKLPTLGPKAFSGLNLPLGLFDMNRMIEWIDGLLGGPIRFEELSIPFAAATADIGSGELVVLNSGPIAPAICASCSVPGFFTPVRRGERLLVDGGVLNNLPVAVVQRMGADYIIAVDLVPIGGREAETPHNIVDTSFASIYLLMRSTHSDGPSAHCTITPDVRHIQFSDLGALPELMRLGREAALSVLPQIQQDLNLV